MTSRGEFNRASPTGFTRRGRAVPAAPSLQRRPYNTVPAAPSLQHCPCSTVPAALSLRHRPCSAVPAVSVIPAEPSLQCHPCNNVPAVPFSQHHSAVTATLRAAQVTLALPLCLRHGSKKTSATPHNQVKSGTPQVAVPLSLLSRNCCSCTRSIPAAKPIRAARAITVRLSRTALCFYSG